MHKTTILCQFGLIICHQLTNSYLHQFSTIFGGNCIILGCVVPVLNHYPGCCLTFIVLTAFTFNPDSRNVEVWVPVGIVLCDIIFVEDHVTRKVLLKSRVSQDLCLHAVQCIGFDTAHQVLGLTAFIYPSMPMLHKILQNRVLLLVDGDIALEIPAPSFTTVGHIHQLLFRLGLHIIDVVQPQEMIHQG